MEDTDNIKVPILIDGDIAFPIYTIRIKYIQDDTNNEKRQMYKKDLPVNKAFNFNSLTRMVREELDIKSLKELGYKFAEEFFKSRKDPKYPYVKVSEPKLVSIEILPVKYEVWVLDWFQHSTFDVGKTDAEVLSSFERFIRRRERELRNAGEDIGCLMGADDRWRWHGAGLSGDKDDHGVPPCRCKHCKAQGKIRIAH